MRAPQLTLYYTTTAHHLLHMHAYTHCSRARQQGPGLAAAAPADNPQNKFVHSRSEQVEGEEVWLTVKR
jgi:hypothetical protein